VSLGLVDKGDTVAIVMGDNGIGIPAADVEHIFDRFYRVDTARSRTGGTGLGLAITKWIAEAHGGTITVQSRVGRGTVFTVTLPREGKLVLPADGARDAESSVPVVEHAEGSVE
jgi:signal transduction histidine kinase